MLCEMCSSPNATLKVEVEGSRITVCEKCSKYGKILGRVTVPLKEKKSSLKVEAEKETETVQIIKTEYPYLIKQAREKLGLKQEEFAKKLDEKESLLHKIESGHLKPDLTLARKIEKFLKITIVEQVEVEIGSKQKELKAGAGLTIGDMIKIKK